MKILKNTVIKAFLVFLTFTLLFAACEQEALQNASRDLGENLINNMADADDPPLGCGTVATAEQIAYLRSKIKDRHAFAPNSEKAKKEIYIPVANHIVRYDNGSGGLTDSELTAIMSSLNGFYDEYGINFTTDCHETNYIDKTDWYNFDASEEYGSDGIGVNNKAYALNIYYIGGTLTSHGNSVYGYAAFPDPDNPTAKGDVFITTEAAKSNWRVLEHEIGHFFSLHHTHGTSEDGRGTTDELVTRVASPGNLPPNCTSAGDTFCDTPADPNLRFNRPNCYTQINGMCIYDGEKSCRDANGDIFVPSATNVMSYTRKGCRSSFSTEQMTEIKRSFNQDRYLVCCKTPSKSAISAIYSSIHKRFNVTINLPADDEWQYKFRSVGTVGWYTQSENPDPNFPYWINVLLNQCNFEIKLRKKCGTTAQGSVAWSDWSEIKTISCNASND